MRAIYHGIQVITTPVRLNNEARQDDLLAIIYFTVLFIIFGMINVHGFQRLRITR